MTIEPEKEIDLTGIRTTQSQIQNADYRAIEKSKLSPMYQHYVEVKEQYPHALLLYRVGDFFETFFQDAILIARELELVLTSKEGGKEIGRVPMTGVPHHAVDRYCGMLVERGYAIAICDQVEDAAAAVGLVRREVTRVLTPGTLLEEGLLPARRNNFLAAVFIDGDCWGLAYADISTGEFLTVQSQQQETLSQELLRLQPSEVLIPALAPDLNRILRPGEGADVLPPTLPSNFCYTLRPQASFVLKDAKQRLLDYFGLVSLESMGCDRAPLGVRAAGGLLEYLADTQKGNPVALQRLRSYSLADYLIIDDRSRRNLEITQTIREGASYGSLLWSIDRTATAMGARSLRRWILQPLLDRHGIQARQTTIGELIDNSFLREELQALLKQIYDLERLAGKVACARATARELATLGNSLTLFPTLATLVSKANSPYLKILQEYPLDLEALGKTIGATLADSLPLAIKEGGLIREGIDTELDELRAFANDTQLWVAKLEATERERTGITNLKIGYNKTFGYYIGISRQKTDLVPDNYIRKQTLTNEERYITPELKEREVRLLNATTERNELEYELFVKLRDRVARESDRIRHIARSIAAVDALCSLAEVAVHNNYCCPEIVDDREIYIEEGRHPVVEQMLPAGFFVPNSTQLGTADLENLPLFKNVSKTPPDLVVLTGPNASGKSCYLRQVGLIQIMAQIGSFVPAKSAKLAICDRVFTRVGAVDDLATGQSTFMVEMNETANILNHASSRSLVLLDEIGRGTATFDGLSIAWSVAEYLATEICARTIFATHYHELNELASLLDNVANYQVTVKELADRIVFLHQVQPGGASKSYGIEAGRLAGLPPSVIDRAKQVLSQIETHSKIAIGLREIL
jgi:DNA mismatch repair protein MutS